MGRSSDFRFWEETLPIHHHGYGGEGDFEVQMHVEDQIGVCSPPLWTRAPINFRQATSSLVPRNHYHSCPSPTYRLRAIMDGRKEMMEMIKNMPESSHELSLKDIVDDQQEMEDVRDKETELAVKKKVKHKRENRIPQKNKNNQICRTESMESEVFLLKMFLPVSLSFKKKPEVRSRSKFCPGQSSEGPGKATNKDWWKRIFLPIIDYQKNTRIKRSMSDISSNRTSKKNCKSRVQRGCLF